MVTGFAPTAMVDFDESIFGPIKHKHPQRNTSRKQSVTKLLPSPLASSVVSNEDMNIGMKGHRESSRGTTHRTIQPLPHAAGVHACTSMDFDESIFGPLGHKNFQEEWTNTTKQDSAESKSIPGNENGNMSMIQSNGKPLSLIVVAQGEEEEYSEGVRDGGRTNGRKKAGDMAAQRRKTSKFEEMMRSLERSSNKQLPKEPQGNEAESSLGRAGEFHNHSGI